MLRVAELQAEDYHMDRPLYFACREDRERFCASVVSGNGKVYHCLLKHKMEKEMSGKVGEAALPSVWVCSDGLLRVWWGRSGARMGRSGARMGRSGARMGRVGAGMVVHLVLYM